MFVFAQKIKKELYYYHFGGTDVCNENWLRRNVYVIQYIRENKQRLED